MALLRRSYAAAWESGSTRASYEGWLEDEVKRLREAIREARDHIPEYDDAADMILKAALDG